MKCSVTLNSRHGSWTRCHVARPGLTFWAYDTKLSEKDKGRIIFINFLISWLLIFCSLIAQLYYVPQGLVFSVLPVHKLLLFLSGVWLSLVGQVSLSTEMTTSLSWVCFQRDLNLKLQTFFRRLKFYSMLKPRVVGQGSSDPIRKQTD